MEKNYKDKDSFIEKEENCTFYPKLNDNYNKRHNIQNRIINGANDNKVLNNNINKKDDNYFEKNQKKQNEIYKQNNFINKYNYNDNDNDNEKKCPFIPNINKIKDIKTIFKDNIYSKFWVMRNKKYINRRLKNINNKKNITNINENHINLFHLKDKLKNNKNNNSLDLNDHKNSHKININYIKKLLHEELQNTKSDEDEIEQEKY